jgi:hypothetical protein
VRHAARGRSGAEWTGVAGNDRARLRVYR